MQGCRFLRTFVTIGLLFLLGGMQNLSTTSGGMPRVGALNSYVDTNVALVESEPSASTPMWLIERVDDPKYFAPMGNRSMALDSDGHPHQVYGGDFLYYAHYDDAGPGLDQGWRIETVDDAGPVGSGATLALDAYDRPHVAYCGREPGEDSCATLKYAHHDGTGWQIEIVDSAVHAGDYTSLKLDASGYPHISYCSYHDYLNHCTGLSTAVEREGGKPNAAFARTRVRWGVG